MVKHRRKPTPLEKFNRKATRICVKTGTSIAVGYIAICVVAVNMNAQALAEPLDLHKASTLHTPAQVDPMTTAPLLRNVADQTVYPHTDRFTHHWVDTWRETHHPYGKHCGVASWQLLR